MVHVMNFNQKYRYFWCVQIPVIVKILKADKLFVNY